MFATMFIMLLLRWHELACIPDFVAPQWKKKSKYYFKVLSFNHFNPMKIVKEE